MVVSLGIPVLSVAHSSLPIKMEHASKPGQEPISTALVEPHLRSSLYGSLLRTCVSTRSALCPAS